MSKKRRSETRGSNRPPPQAPTRNSPIASSLDRLFAFFTNIGMAFKILRRDGIFDGFLHRFVVLLDAVDAINIAIIDIVPNDLLFFGCHHFIPPLTVSGIAPCFLIIYWRPLRIPPQFSLPLTERRTRIESAIILTNIPLTIHSGSLSIPLKQNTPDISCQ
jgi:hypothetical protein